MQILENHQLADITRISIGGSADTLVITETDDDMAAAKKMAIEKKVACTVLPSCDVLISDAGIRGIVVLTQQQIDACQRDNKITFFADVAVTDALRQELHDTDIEAEDIANTDAVSPGLFITAAGLSEYIMGKVCVADDGITIKNLGGATADDVIMLTSFLKQQVRDTYGVQLMAQYELFGFG